jgi:acyl dehydratase
VIAHGMSVLALVCEEVVDRYRRRPDPVRGIGCRFSSPVLPGEPLRTTLRHSGGTVRFSCATPRGSPQGRPGRARPGREVASDA